MAHPLYKPQKGGVMEKIKLGSTDLYVSRIGFGGIPIQRITQGEADRLLKKAYAGGINLFDTSPSYRDSEEKIGHALFHVRKDVVLATKTRALDEKTLFANLERSLEHLRTDYIDLYQIHDPKEYPGEEIQEALLKARDKGMIRYYGLTSHKLDLALKTVREGFFSTVQYPLSYLSSPDELTLIEVCRAANVGVLAMKALAGGLLGSTKAAFAFLRQFENVVPLWGIQQEEELDEFLHLEKDSPTLNGELLKIIEKDRKELSGLFCRGCTYCQPCPVEIPISSAARMYSFIRKSQAKRYLNEEWWEKMARIEKCTNCGSCIEKCPYGLDVPALLKYMLDDYRTFYEQNRPHY